MTVGLILFWFDKNLLLSLLEFVIVASTCTEFSLEALPEQWTFPLFLNLFVTFPLGSSLLIGEDYTEMGFGRNEFWNPVQWTKYSHLELIFLNFLNKVLVFLPVEPVSLWHKEGFWPKDVFLICLHLEVVECRGKVILLLLLCCLCVCGIVLTNVCGACSPSPLPYDDDAGRLP